MSWVWQQFICEFADGIKQFSLQALKHLVNGTTATNTPVLICGQVMASTTTVSTKLLARHLDWKHCLKPPENTLQQSVQAYFMPGGGGLVSTRLHFPGLNLSRCEANFLKHYLILTTQFKNLNRQNLKETCMRLVVNCNILISLVDTPEFRACCKMANPQTRSPMCNITYLNKGIPEKARMIKCASSLTWRFLISSAWPVTVGLPHHIPWCSELLPTGFLTIFKHKASSWVSKRFMDRTPGLTYAPMCTIPWKNLISPVNFTVWPPTTFQTTKPW